VKQLVVVVASISQHQSPLALGNILGSSISNILGAFSLGLIFTPKTIIFDKSAKIYTAVLLGLTSFFSLFVLFFESLGRYGGGILVATFIIYTISVAFAIYKGIVSPPVDEDSDSDSDSSDSDSDSDSDEESSIPLKRQKPSRLSPHSHNRSHSSSTTTLHEGENATASTNPESGALLAKEMFEDDESPNPSKPHFDHVPLSGIATHTSPLKTTTVKKAPHSTYYHLAHLFLGLLALSLSGFLLSHSVSTLAEQFSLSSTILGTTLLSLATTLPEKFLSILSSRRGEHSIFIANTAGSNIFLVTLCAGVLFLSGDLVELAGAATLFEVACMWGSSLVLFGIVMIGGSRWMGWALLAGYFAFIIMEFTVDRR
jgi:Ca2+/Na+ antiporter